MANRTQVRDVGGFYRWVSREELESALAELNAPVFAPGDIVQLKGDSDVSYIVAAEGVARVHRAEWTSIKATDIVVIGLHDGDSYSGPVSRYERVAK